MEPKHSYHTPHLDAITEHDAALRFIAGRHHTMQPQQQSDPHAELCHKLLFGVRQLAMVEHWHRWNGVWCRLDNPASERGQRQLLPLHLIPLAEILEAYQ